MIPPLPQMETFGRLTVIRKPHAKHWICRCECGNVKMIRRWCLVNGHVKSCGCLRRNLFEQMKKNVAKAPESRRKLCTLCGKRAEAGYRKLKGGGVLCNPCTHTARGRRFYREYTGG